MNKSYTPDNLIRESRFVNFMAEQSAEMQTVVAARIGALIEENRAYCTSVNFGHMRNLLTALAIHEYDLQNGLSAEESLNRISRAMEVYMLPSRRKFEKYLSNHFLFSVASPLIPRLMQSANGQGFMTRAVKVGGGFGFDTTECLFFTLTRKYGCPDLGRHFCAIDEYMYSHIPNVRFLRTGTLCRGCKACDFRFVWQKGANL